MPRIITPRMFKWKASCIALAMAFVPALRAQAAAQQATQPVAQLAQTANPASASSAAAVPVPLQPKALLKVFISNVPSEDAPGELEGPDKLYNGFYAAMQRAGQYELVADPSQADLLFELLYARPWQCVAAGFDELNRPREREEFDPVIQVTAWERRTHALWQRQAVEVN